MSIPQTNTCVQAGALPPDRSGTAYQAFPCPVPSPFTFASTATWGSAPLPGVLKPAANFESCLLGWDPVRAPTVQVAAITRVKTVVRVAANTSAWLIEQEGDLLVKFDDSGAYRGVELRLSGAWRARPLLLPQKKVQKFDFRDAFASQSCPNTSPPGKLILAGYNAILCVAS